MALLRLHLTSVSQTLYPPTVRVQEEGRQQLVVYRPPWQGGWLWSRLAIFVSTGFGDRLLSEVKKLAPKDVKIKVRLETLKRGCWVALAFREMGTPLRLRPCPRLPFSIPPYRACSRCLGFEGDGCVWGQVVTQPFALS